MCRSGLYRHYEKTLTVYELTRSFSDKLDFDISQEEMVSLLYILADAGILKTKAKYEYLFIPFCFKYFTVIKKGASVRLTNEKTFTESYRRILRDEGGNGLIKIKKKLEPVLKGIRKNEDEKSSFFVLAPHEICIEIQRKSIGILDSNANS